MRVGGFAVPLFFCVVGFASTGAQNQAVTDTTKASLPAEAGSDELWPATVIGTKDQLAERKDP